MPATRRPMIDSADARRSGRRALRRGRMSMPNHAYLVTSTVQNREPCFADFAAGCAAARCFKYGRVLGDATLLAWVLMPDHVHWMIQLGTVDSLASVVNRLKSASARHANRVLRRSGPLWASAFHDRALRAEEDARASARYVVANPLRAGLVSSIGDYPFWDAVWL